MHYDVASCDTWPFIPFQLTIHQISVIHYNNEDYRIITSTLELTIYLSIYIYI